MVCISKAQGNLYIGVMIFKTPQIDIPVCKQCGSEVDVHEKNTGLNATFVTLDCGKYGSKGFYLHSFMNQTQLKGKWSRCSTVFAADPPGV